MTIGFWTWVLAMVIGSVLGDLLVRGIRLFLARRAALRLARELQARMEAINGRVTVAHLEIRL